VKLYGESQGINVRLPLLSISHLCLPLSESNRKPEGRKPVDAAVLSISEVMGPVKKMSRVDLKRQKNISYSIVLGFVE